MLGAEELATLIDQTLLKPTVGFHDGAEWIAKNRDEGFASLCVPPFLVPLAANRLAGTTTRVCSVAAFPLGYANTQSKVVESRHLVELGAVEVDVVVNIAALIEGEDEFVRQELRAVVDTVDDASNGTGLVKVILETGYLSDEDIFSGSLLAAEAGAAYVKTSTGFGPRGASVEDVRIMRAAIGEALGVKASGGIRDLDGALALIDAGATRLGMSAGADVLAEARSRGL